MFQSLSVVCPRLNVSWSAFILRTFPTLRNSWLRAWTSGNLAVKVFQQKISLSNRINVQYIKKKKYFNDSLIAFLTEIFSFFTQPKLTLAIQSFSAIIEDLLKCQIYRILYESQTHSFNLYVPLSNRQLCCCSPVFLLTFNS